MAVYGVFQITDYLMGTKGFLGNNEHFDVIVARALRFPAVLVTFAPKVTPASRKKEYVFIQEQGFFTPAVFRMTEFWFCGNKIPRRFAHSE